MFRIPHENASRLGLRVHNFIMLLLNSWHAVQLTDHKTVKCVMPSHEQALPIWNECKLKEMTRTTRGVSHLSTCRICHRLTKLIWIS